MVGGLIGVAMLAAYVVYVVVLTPPVPDLQKAPAQEVVAYIANQRGLGTRPQIEQQRFLERWRDLLLQDAKKKEELRACFQSIDEDLRKEFSSEIFKHFKRSFLDDARAYASLPQAGRYAFLQERVGEYRQRAVFLKDVAVGFTKEFRGGEDDVREWVMQHTTAEERAMGEPYVEALKKIEVQIHRERRAADSAPASAAVSDPAQPPGSP